MVVLNFYIISTIKCECVSQEKGNMTGEVEYH